MTTTNANNASKLTPPPALSAASAANSGGLVTGYFRQSGDNGVNFSVTPVYLHPADLARAVAANPHEYATSPTGFAAWVGGYNNAAQPVGGHGRLQGATSFAD